MSGCDTKRLTISTAFDRFATIYSHADALTTVGGRGERLAFLFLACGDLSRCVRKQQKHLYPIAIAQVFAWFCCLGEELFRTSGGHVLAKGMCEKYPQGLCGYCGKMPCECSEEYRQAHTQQSANLSQLEWTISSWQTNLARVYGKANQEGGVPRALNRLFEEVAEIGLLLNLADGIDEDLATLSDKMARELTDVLAWLLALSELMGLHLEDLILDLYGKGCPVCRAPQCVCKNFVTRPHSGGLTHRFMGAEDIFRCIEVGA